MLIHTLDLGRRSGWAIGPAGQVPNSGYLVLRGTSDPPEQALWNLRCYLETMWAKRRPDLFVIERPMTLAAWIENARRQGKMHNPQSFEQLKQLAGECEATAYGLQVPLENVSRTSVMWKVTGQQTFGSREANKKAVIDALIRAKMLPHGSSDQDRADAIALHVVASGKFAKNQHANFGLFA